MWSLCLATSSPSVIMRTVQESQTEPYPAGQTKRQECESGSSGTAQIDDTIQVKSGASSYPISPFDKPTTDYNTVESCHKRKSPDLWRHCREAPMTFRMRNPSENHVVHRGDFTGRSVPFLSFSFCESALYEPNSHVH